MKSYNARMGVPVVRLLLVAVMIAGFTGCGGGTAQPSHGLFGSTSRGSVAVQFGDTSQTNLPSTFIRANEISVTFYDAPTGTRAIDVGGWVDDGGGSFHNGWLLLPDLFGEPVTGKVYPLDTLDAGQPSGAPDTAAIIFQGTPADEWIASSGAVTVQSLVSVRAVLSFDAVTMVPRDSNAMGSFTMSGTLTITNINSVCNFCPE